MPADSMPGEEGGCQLSSLPLSPPFPSQCSPEELPVGSSHSLGAFGVHALQGHPENTAAEHCWKITTCMQLW